MASCHFCNKSTNGKSVEQNDENDMTYYVPACNECKAADEKRRNPTTANKQPWLIDGEALEEWLNTQFANTPYGAVSAKIKEIYNAVQSGRFNVKESEPRKCMACNGSGVYDSHGSPPCGACDGTGFEG